MIGNISVGLMAGVMAGLMAGLTIEKIAKFDKNKLKKITICSAFTFAALATIIL